MALELKVMLLFLFIGASVGLSGQAVPQNLSHDELISMFSSKKNPYPDPTDNLFIAYPNPTSNDRFSIEMDYAYQSTLLIQIYDMYGRIYYTDSVNKSHKNLQYDIDAYDWPDGMYVIAITGDGFRGSQRILKE